MAFLDETGLAALWNLIQAEDAKGAKVAIGTYTGTGKYGSANPNTLTFDFEPKLLFVTFEGAPPHQYNDTDGFLYYACRFEFIKGITEYDSEVVARASGVATSFSYDEPLVVTFDGKTVSWYLDAEASYTAYTSGAVYTPTPTSANAARQNNKSGTVYTYVAIGLGDEVEIEYPDSGGDEQKELIAFTYQQNGNSTTKTYTAEKGMTWGEWVASEYNTDGFHVIEAEIFDSSDLCVAHGDTDADVRYYEEIESKTYVGYV